jgi:hypothetical protein
MEECPICFEPMKKKYQLDNCKHSICISCAKQCKARSEEPCVNINSTFQVHIKNGNPIKCPLCRTLEQQMTVDEFKKNDPDKYDEWMQLELHCDEWGSSFYCHQEKFLIQKSWIPPKYNRIPKRVSWKAGAKSFK